MAIGSSGNHVCIIGDRSNRYTVHYRTVRKMEKRNQTPERPEPEINDVDNATVGFELDAAEHEFCIFHKCVCNLTD